MTKGTEITTLDEVAAALLDPTVKLSVVEEDGATVSRRIIEEILTSDNPLAETEVMGGRDLLGVPLRVSSVAWQNSDFENEEGLGIYVVIHAQTTDGATVVVTSGAAKVVAKVYQLARTGQIPFDAMFTEKATNKAGRTILNLVAAKWEAGSF